MCGPKRRRSCLNQSLGDLDCFNLSSFGDVFLPCRPVAQYLRDTFTLAGDASRRVCPCSATTRSQDSVPQGAKRVPVQIGGIVKMFPKFLVKASPDLLGHMLPMKSSGGMLVILLGPEYCSHCFRDRLRVGACLARSRGIGPTAATGSLSQMLPAQ